MVSMSGLELGCLGSNLGLLLASSVKGDPSKSQLSIAALTVSGVVVRLKEREETQRAIARDQLTVTFAESRLLFFKLTKN